MNATSKNGEGNGPDPLQVWNRNRRKATHSKSATQGLICCPAAPAATPKQFTDEELKQQYGIHLATRLQADGDGKEAKWADIDDDEDDWAPETIEWNDGTKITLPPTDTASVLAQDQAAALALKEKQDEEAKSKVSAPKPTTIVGPNATVLKVGAAAQPKTGGLVLKAPSDKPTLVAKPTAPAPVRSPWASLPPVDKVPPVPINPPSQQPISRFEQNDRRGSETVPTPSPAVQIAADSFTRTRRDTPNGTPGQLYNSQSGQYEPVNAGRRGSIRKEQNFRPPALLQRPTNNDQHGPAEPSAAFQTNRSQQDGGIWNRRASSTFSGDSGPRDRKSSMSKGSDQSRIPNDVLQQRRESETLHSPLTPGSAQTRHSQRDDSQPPVAPHAQHVNDASPASASPQLSKLSLAGQPAVSTLPDEISIQKQLMREKREAAIKRRREQEEREEAERKERIRIKMESLGMSPLPDKKELTKDIENKEMDRKDIEKKPIEKRDIGVDKSEAKAPDEKEPEVKDIEHKKDTVPETVPVPVKSQGPATSTSHSPPKPPIPDASGAPKQYGMMKVHGPPLTNGIIPSERPSTEKAKPPGQQASSPQQEFLNRPTDITPPIVNGDRDASKQHAEHLVPKSPINRNQDLRGPRQQPWKSVPNDAEKFPGWNGVSMTTHSSHVGNLWGPPANQNALGNGTFDRNVQRPQSRQAPYQEHYISSVPQPIGPPRHLQRPRESPESNRAQETVSVPVVEDFQTVPSFPSSEAAPTLPRSWPDIADHTASREPLLPTHPGSISQQKLQPIGEQFVRQQDQQRSSLAAWGNFQVTSARDDAEKRQQAAQGQAARLVEEARTGVRHEIQLPVMNETWRQIKVDDQANQRKVVGVAKEQNVPSSITTPYMNGDIRSAPFGGSSTITATNGAGRSSRFFPGAGQGMHAQNVRAVSYTVGFNRTPSPPPPEIADHPAYSRDQDHPVVNLPFAKPKPKVRLPPSFVAPAQTPMPEVHVMPLRAVSQPLVNNPTWQDRFNGLLGVKKPSPERKFAHVAEFSSTKVPLEVPSIQVSAAVSLPPKDETSVIEEPVNSKHVEDEEALFENREFGDLPVIKLPTHAPETGWQPARPPKSRGHPNKSNKPVEALSKDAFEEIADRVPNGILIFVYMPGAAPETRKPKTMHVGLGNRPNNHPQRTRHISGTPKTARPYKPRDSSATYSSPKSTLSGLPRNPVPNLPSPSPRAPYSKTMTWSARVAGMAQ